MPSAQNLSVSVGGTPGLLTVFCWSVRVRVCWVMVVLGGGGVWGGVLSLQTVTQQDHIGLVVSRPGTHTSVFKNNLHPIAGIDRV